MSLQNLLTKHNFSENPFRYFMAEDEGNHLKEWFVPPPFLSTILGDIGKKNAPLEPVSNLIFGKPGSGKTAIRLMMEREIMKRADDSLLLRYEDFSDIMSCESPGSLSAHVEELLRLGTIGLLGFWHQTGGRYSYLSNSDKRELFGLASHYYECLHDNAKQIYTCNLPFFSRLADLAQRKGKTLLDLYNATISTIRLEKIEPTSWSPKDCASEQQNPHFRLQRFWFLAKSMGVKFIWYLVDKVDETQDIKTGKEIYRCMSGLLHAQRIIEFRDAGKQVICFKFFLTRPEELLPLLKDGEFRTDRVKTEEIKWTRRDLKVALHKRLTYFSYGRVFNFDDICEPSCQGTHDRLLDECGLRPRTLFRMAHEIFTEFQKTAREGVDKIDRQAIEAGITKGLNAVYG